jgi:predicted ribosome quality control (RQC) complex YloA/Tae2 family protein
VSSLNLSIGVNEKETEKSIEKFTEKLREVINYVYKSENHVDLMAPSTLLDGYYRVFNSLTDDQTFLDTLEVDKEYFYRIKSVLSYPYQILDCLF